MDDFIVLDNPNSPFPPTYLARSYPNGLLAIGGDLSPRRLLDAYGKGIFPWFNPGEPVVWWSPDPRCILRTENIHISKSLHKALKKSSLTVTFDKAFTAVMEACGEPRKDAPESWIHKPMLDAYTALHELGFAHSVEIWDEDDLVGGLYGVAIGQVFFGESMFSKVSNTSKIALVYLTGQLREWGFPIIDCQVTNDHLLSLGAEEIPRDEFEKILLEYKMRPGPPRPWIINWHYS